MSSSWKSLFLVLFSGRMLLMLFMGLASGLPLLLTITLLQAWLKGEGVSLTMIGAASLVGLPYSLKFLWAPFLDHLLPPFFGRRRGWLLLTQVALVLAIAGLGFTSPGVSLWPCAIMALLVTFFSATQDVILDAYRREMLVDEELGLGSSLFVNGYRVGMLIAGSGGLILADHYSFSVVYGILAAVMATGVIVTLLAPEPRVEGGRSATLTAAVLDPLKEYFQRDQAWLILSFILLYKIGDTMASAMTMPFYLDTGFSKSQIGVVVKFYGFWATIAGGLLGGILMLRVGINRSLWIFGVLQAVSTVGFAILDQMGPVLWGLAAVIAFENLSGGMGTAAFVAYMAVQTDKRFTATQYALLSSLMGVPRTVLSAPTGWMAEHLGWSGFFIFCALIALPGMLLLVRCAPWRRAAGSA